MVGGNGGAEDPAWLGDHAGMGFEGGADGLAEGRHRLFREAGRRSCRQARYVSLRNLSRSSAVPASATRTEPNRRALWRATAA